MVRLRLPSSPGDFTGDGASDLITRLWDRTLYVWVGDCRRRVHPPHLVGERLDCHAAIMP
jgi:hypothetical protein